MSDVTLLTQVVAANPTDTTARLVLADAVQEAGDEKGATLIRANAERRAAYDAAIATGGETAARAMIEGYLTERADTRRPWRTKIVRSGGALRAALCREVGATDGIGRALTCVSFAVIAGDAAPTYVGESYHHETPGGRLVRFPNAYRRAYGKPVYCPAHHEITVGAEWLLLHAAELVG